MRKPGQFRAFLAIAWYAFRAQTRNPATFFFGFIFPIAFISIFGLIGNNQQKIASGLVNEAGNNSMVQTLEKQPYLTINKGTLYELQKQLARGKVTGIIVVQKKQVGNEQYAITVIRSSGYPQESAAITSVVNGIVDKTNLRIAGVTNPAVTIQTKELEGRKPRYIDFALPGQIGFALLSTALFGTVFGLIYLKKAGILKRMFATPTKPLTILLAQGLSRLIVALAQTALILVFGVLVFKFYLPHGFATFIELIILSAIGLVAFLGFGYFIAGLANDENAAGPLTNLISLPQFLLSGTFFSTDNFPTWVQPLANNLPLSYFNQAIRKITTEGGSLTDTWPYLLGLIAWGAVMYILAARTFKWE
jgi:ABC-2 type transport system permease protein